MSGTLLVDHLTASELSGLSAHNRVLVQAVRIISSESGKKSAVRQNRDTHQEISPALVGFECVHCLSPEASTITEKSKRFNKVFPGSIESIGASLELLREKHFSANAAEMQQRCQLLPFTAREIFDKSAAAIRKSSSSHAPNANLDIFCQLVAGRLGLTSKEPGSMTGIIFQPSEAGPRDPGMLSNLMMIKSEENSSTEGGAWPNGDQGLVSFSSISVKNISLLADNSSSPKQSSANPLHKSESAGSEIRFSPKTSTTLPYLLFSSPPKKINVMERTSAITATENDETETESERAAVRSSISGTKSEEIETESEISKLNSQMKMMRSEMTSMRTEMKNMKSEMAVMMFELGQIRADVSEIKNMLCQRLHEEAETESETAAIMSGISRTKETETKSETSELKSEMEMMKSEMTATATEMKSMKSEMKIEIRQIRAEVSEIKNMLRQRLH